LTVLKMTGYIHKNYDSIISSNDVAAAATICRSKCYELFSKYIEQSPNTYLTNYRIQKSCEMLRNTYMSICEIAMSCGFQNASYFTQVFRKVTSLTPKNYRERFRTLR
jgi:transcriptional regulator GlxA family with amidase domain